MTTKIEREFVFQCGTYVDSTFIINLYTVNFGMYVSTEDIREQNIAMERIKYYLYDCLENAIIVEDKEKEVIDKYLNADLKVCVLPSLPYDQMIAIMLLKKLNSILEDKLVVVEVKISSKLSDGVYLLYDIEDSAGIYDSQDGWWNNKKPVINGFKFKKNDSKILKLFNQINLSWDDIGLSWDEKSKNTSTATVVPLRETEN